jgi:hypothetical protein
VICDFRKVLIWRDVYSTQFSKENQTLTMHVRPRIPNYNVANLTLGSNHPITWLDKNKVNTNPLLDPSFQVPNHNISLDLLIQVSSLSKHSIIHDHPRSSGHHDRQAPTIITPILDAHSFKHYYELHFI